MSILLYLWHELTDPMHAFFLALQKHLFNQTRRLRNPRPQRRFLFNNCAHLSALVEANSSTLHRPQRPRSYHFRRMYTSAIM